MLKVLKYLSFIFKHLSTYKEVYRFFKVYYNLQFLFCTNVYSYFYFKNEIYFLYLTIFLPLLPFYVIIELYIACLVVVLV